MAVVACVRGDFLQIWGRRVREKDENREEKIEFNLGVLLWVKLGAKLGERGNSTSTIGK